MRGLFDARALLVERLVAGRDPRAAERSPSLGAIWQTWMATIGPGVRRKQGPELF